jgi:4-hydroxy-tetrahydrodipicolinate synthase
LTDQQKEQVIRTAVEAADGKIAVLAGALEPSTSRTIEAVQEIAAYGADYAVITTPYYFEADADCQKQHFIRVGEAASIPVLLYNIPSMTHNAVSAETVAQVLSQPNIVGIKDSEGDLDKMKALIALKAQRPDFVVFQGAEKLAVEALNIGADGIVAGMGNLVPGIFYDLFTQAKNGEQAQATQMQASINDLWKLHTHGYWLVCLKYAASLLGFGSGVTCDRDHTLSEDAKASIHQLVSTYAKVVS